MNAYSGAASIFLILSVGNDPLGYEIVMPASSASFLIDWISSPRSSSTPLYLAFLNLFINDLSLLLN